MAGFVARLQLLWLLQILNEQPTDAVNLLQTSLMIKKTANNLSSDSAQDLSLQVSCSPNLSDGALLACLNSLSHEFVCIAGSS